jgi:hypothetical protein
LNLQRFKVLYICGNYSSILHLLSPLESNQNYKTLKTNVGGESSYRLNILAPPSYTIHGFGRNAGRVFYFDEIESYEEVRTYSKLRRAKKLMAFKRDVYPRKHEPILRMANLILDFGQQECCRRYF